MSATTRIVAGPDDALIRLGVLLDAAWEAQNRAWSDAEALAEAAAALPTEAYRAADAALARTRVIVDQIEVLQAATVAGLAVKRRAVAWCWCGEPITPEALADTKHPTTDMRLIAGIMTDLMAMGIPADHALTAREGGARKYSSA